MNMKMTYTQVIAMCIVCTILHPGTSFAASLTVVRDLVSSSAPATTTASHTIEFTVTNAVPASGSVLITPQAGAFSVPSGFDYTDVDLAIDTPYAERTLGATAGVTEDGVSVTTGSSGSITITLNSTQGIAAGERVRVKLGTNATFGVAGDRNIQNPSSVGSYRVNIETRNQVATRIDSADAMIVVVAPVSTLISPPPVPPTRSNGLPTGELAAGNATIEVSLNTNEFAFCRYATTTNVLYADMLGSFNSTSGGTLHYRAIGGHQDGTAYNYYVRCTDFYGSENEDDYPISFSLADSATTTSSGTSGSGSSGSSGSGSSGSGTSGPGGSGNGVVGNGGAGAFPGGSQYLYLASVIFSGKTAPLSAVTVLKDGEQAGTVFATGSGDFETTVTGLERGTYSFAIYSTDSQGAVSASVSSTLSIGQDTNNSVSNLILPPSISLEKNTVEVGESVRVFGRTLPGREVEIYTRKQGSGALGDAKRHTTESTQGTGQAAGLWEIIIEGSEFTRGTYEIEARTILATSTQSKTGYSKALFLGVGEEASPDLSLRADINGDGKVNLVDFSIMLTFWNSSAADADINADGTVNLADFSILLFNWTG